MSKALIEKARKTDKECRHEMLSGDSVCISCGKKIDIAKDYPKLQNAWDKYNQNNSLKPCPFCGCADLKIHGDDPETLYITCWCGAELSGDREITKESWNTRVDTEHDTPNDSYIDGMRIQSKLDEAVEIIKVAKSCIDYEACAYCNNIKTCVLPNKAEKFLSSLDKTKEEL